MLKSARTSEWTYRVLCGLVGFSVSLMLMGGTRDLGHPVLTPNVLVFNQTWYKRWMTQQCDYTNMNIDQRIHAIRTNERAVSTELLQTRVLCMVLSRPNGTAHRDAVLLTWGKRCDRLVFLIGGTNHQVQHLTVRADLVTFAFNDSMDKTWYKVRQGVKYVNRVYRGQFDWFLRIDDDGFVIMENLIMFVRTKNRTAPEMYGVHYKAYGGYVGTGAGLALSSENFAKLVTAIDLPKCATYDTHNDDVEIARCLKLVGIQVTDSRDERQRFRFFPLPPMETVNGKNNPDWLWQYLAFTIKEGLDCCSDDFIGFHYISPEQMKVLELLIYYIHPFSVRESWQPPQTLPQTGTNQVRFSDPEPFTTLTPTPATPVPATEPP